MGRNPAVLVSDSEDDLPPIYNEDTLPDLQNADTNSTVSGNLREMLNCAAALVLPVHSQGTRHTPGTNPPKDPWILDSMNPRALPEWMVDDQEPLVPEPDLEWTALNDDSQQKRTADDVLQLLKGLVEDNQRMQTIRLRQLHVLEDMVRWTERGHLSYKFPVKIAFLGQTGIDDKGLTRQTATYLIQGLSRSPVFVGEVGRLTLTSDTSALVAKDGGQCRCEVTGRLVGFILTHAGLPVNLFSQSLARLLCGEYDCIDLADCPDGQLRGQIQKVKDRDPRTFPSNEAQDLAEAVGFHGLLTPTNKDVLLEASIAYRTSVSNRAQIQAFMKGLDETGVLSVLRGQSAAAVQLLSGSGIRPLTAGAVYDLFVVDFSVEGSNSRADEEIIMLELSFFLQACEQRESSCSLADVLEFCSGSRTIPPGGLGGFNSLPTIAFRTSGLPTASTCACSLTLPRHLPENSTLKDVMEMAIVSSPNFDD
ncbi:G2/M phase-specific E3 ubiquitin-protein ligase-like [Littorina saxatilis]|uniref:G2/M phase-specific E3 ubiquitin-protein ligase-like n=1 Tax=Littorina saxatilis TaxID=31220 RepID=UPI0038B5B5D1